MNDIINSSYSIYFISFIAFVAVLLLIEGAYMFYRSLQGDTSLKVNRRLRALSAVGVTTKDAISLLNTKQLSSIPWLNKLFTRIPRMHALDLSLEQAGMEISISRFIGIQIICVLIIFAILTPVLKASYLLSIPLSIFAGCMIPLAVVNAKQRKRKELFSHQLPDTLDYIARSMRAGNPFSAAIKSASTEMPQPISGEFAITFDELNYGLDMATALHNLGERTGNEEIRYFITAVLVQRQTGGNLADVLNRISAVMRSRANTYREIRILASEMSYSANVLIALPFLVAGALMILNPDYLKILLEHDFGYVIIGIQILLMAVGYLVIQRMVNFRV